jgi:predicted phage terminase large subunit-like protein
VSLSSITPEEYAALISVDQQAFTEECFLQVSPADKYQHNWHIECIIEHLTAVESGELKRLLIMMPPREMKSITITIAWTAWLLGHHPDWRIICASYGDALAKRQSIDARLVMESEVYKTAFPSTRLAVDQNEKGMFMTTRRGFRKATSVGGQVLGDGGDVLIFDDLLKADEAPSDTVRNNTNAWLDQSFLTRANNPATARMVGVAQRLHMDDPMGHLMERGGWHTLILPAEFKRKTMIEIRGKVWEKEEGELFNPNRLTREILDQKLRDLGPTAYAGQYMQNPIPADGGMFKGQWLQYHSVTDWRGMNGYILCDPANSKKKNSGHDPDWSVFMVVGLAADNNYYIADMVRDRLNPAERVDMLMKLHRKWNRAFGKPPRVGVEQYGMMTDAFFIKQRQGQDNYRFPIVELGGTMKKEDRVRMLVTPFSDGRVYLPSSLPYQTVDGERLDLIKELIAEYDTFPLGRHDDIMDAIARILDPKLNAVFPMVRDDVEIYRAGQAHSGDYDANDFRTW